MLEDVQIFTYRGLFKRILQTPYLKHGFNFQAHYNNLYNIVYLHKHEESYQEKIDYKNDARNRYMGNRFESLMTTDSDCKKNQMLETENNSSQNKKYVPPNRRTQPKEVR